MSREGPSIMPWTKSGRGSPGGTMGWYATQQPVVLQPWRSAVDSQASSVGSETGNRPTPRGRHQVQAVEGGVGRRDARTGCAPRSGPRRTRGSRRCRRRGAGRRSRRRRGRPGSRRTGASTRRSRPGRSRRPRCASRVPSGDHRTVEGAVRVDHHVGARPERHQVERVVVGRRVAGEPVVREPRAVGGPLEERHLRARRPRRERDRRAAVRRDQVEVHRVHERAVREEPDPRRVGRPLEGLERSAPGRRPCP